ncbi:uncharacterized protein EV420DRAFT_1484279 [Desarmillaria tabescens]|uniref:Uncharacterized protein n=1 Tax=Armillaria tabescens TaxID=1929756 RepID=A0AA39MTW1_ARMTA|nr:uncharacterized protein EV420DRAFT_1484279 [Desarmillaria tabescens]KAK0445640.1 hypothetical protein EV420DRAFT_1484279 [Desarmillaria tabescens]
MQGLAGLSVWDLPFPVRTCAERVPSPTVTLNDFNYRYYNHDCQKSRLGEWVPYRRLEALSSTFQSALSLKIRNVRDHTRSTVHLYHQKMDEMKEAKAESYFQYSGGATDPLKQEDEDVLGARTFMKLDTAEHVRRQLQKIGEERTTGVAICIFEERAGFFQVGVIIDSPLLARDPMQRILWIKHAERSDDLHARQRDFVTTIFLLKASNDATMSRFVSHDVHDPRLSFS